MATTEETATTTPGGGVMITDEAEIEKLLSEKIKEGYVLMEATCPKCVVPLVKNAQIMAAPKSLSIDDISPSMEDETIELITRKVSVEEPIVVPSASFEQPFQPVDGVPMCVGCDSHVITSETEIAILEQGDTLKDKGTIYVALETATEPSTVDEITAADVMAEDEQLAAAAAEVPMAEPEIINLEHVTEDDVVLMGSGHRSSQIMVDIETVHDSVEMMVSPKMGDETKPIVVEELGGGDDNEKEAAAMIEDAEEHSERREIATKVLGAKMLQGWTLKEKVCDSCAMPMMEYKSKESCPVCPALAKAAKKKAKAAAKAAAETERLERQAQFQTDLMERTEQFPHIQAQREAIEVRAFHEDEEATLRATERKRALLEEKERILALESTTANGAEENQNQHPSDSAETETEQEASPEDRARAAIEQEKMELQRLEAIAKEEEERRELLAKSNGKETEIALAETKAKQEAAAKELAKEAEAIEALGTTIMADDDDKTEAMKKDQLVEEHRKNVAHKAHIDDQVATLEEERLKAAMEARRIAEERRIESESRMIAALEADAAMKAMAAEEAIRRAKEALQEVSNTKQQIIFTTIQQAEQEALAETEDELKSRFEKHSEPVTILTAEEIYQERWETLRLEARAILTRRVLKGWAITPEACVGEECHNSPLIEKDGVKECVVCGGCGNGKDGAYATDEEEPEIPTTEQSHVPPSVAKSMANAKENEILGEDWLGNGQEEKFEEMRKIYAMEMGKKMLAGWKIVDSSCPACVMPMMMDDKGNTDICVVKGCKGTTTTTAKQTFDASTIATKDMTDLLEEDAAQKSIRAVPTDEASLVSTIMKQAPKQQKKRKPVVSSDPPAYKPNISGVIKRGSNAAPKTIIPLPTDLADASAIRELVGGAAQEIRDDRQQTLDASTETVANLFLKSPHGYDFQDFGKSMSIDEVKELVEIFLVTNLDKAVSESFKLEVAMRIINKMKNIAKGRQAASPPRRLEINTAPPRQFRFTDDDFAHSEATTRSKQQQRSKPFPEASSARSPLPPRSPGFRTLSPTYVPQIRSPRSPRDDVSVLSRASTVASDALESIYDRIDQCKKKLLDPSNSIDEQIATAALLEKLAQAAVAMKDMECLVE